MSMVDPLNRLNHYGSQPISSVRGLEDELAHKQPENIKLQAISDAEMQDAPQQIAVFTSSDTAVMKKIGPNPGDLVDGNVLGSALAMIQIGGADRIKAFDGRSALMGTTTYQPTIAFLDEAGRSGAFRLVDTSDDPDLNTKVTADTAQAIYIPVGSKAWMRVFDGRLIFDWFGAVPNDYTQGAGQDCLAAFNALQTFLLATRRNAYTGKAAGAPEVFLPGAQYYFSDALQFKETLRFSGQGMGCQDGWPTVLLFAANKAGIVTNESYTLGDAQQSPATTTAHGSIIQGFNIVSLGGTPNGTLTTDLLYSGIRCRTRTFIRDCRVSNFRGVGICHSANVGDGSDPFHGNCNGWVTENVRIEGCRTGGHFVSGGDANGGRGVSIDVASCGRFGIYDESFLTNTYEACESDGNALMSNTGLTQTATVYDSGFFYYAKIGATHAQLIATAPASNANWLVYSAAGGALGNFPQWSATPTQTYLPGGAYGFAGTHPSVVINPYYETGQAPPQFSSAQVLGSPLTHESFYLNAGIGTPSFGTRSPGTALLIYKLLSASTVDYALGVDNSTLWYSVPDNSSFHKFYTGVTVRVTIDGSGINIASGNALRVNSIQVVGARKAGWATATGTATRTTFDTATVTLQQLAERVKAVIDDLHGTAGHGLIGT